MMGVELPNGRKFNVLLNYKVGTTLHYRKSFKTGFCLVAYIRISFQNLRLVEIILLILALHLCFIIQCVEDNDAKMKRIRRPREEIKTVAGYGFAIQSNIAPRVRSVASTVPWFNWHCIGKLQVQQNDGDPTYCI